ncbi:DNA N-6-adenine-methyltransferase [Haemophilus sp. SZY H56]
MTEQQFDKDTWQTPHYVFEWLSQRFGLFDLDGYATANNALTCHYIGEPNSDNDEHQSIADDFLMPIEQMLDVLLDEVAERCSAPLRIYVNPPYSNVTPYLQRAKELCNAGYLVVMLLNNDKSTQWYQNHIHNVANEVIDITGGRIAFINPVTGKEIKGNSKGQMVVVFDPTMEDYVTRSISLDFIKKVGGYSK